KIGVPSFLIPEVIARKISASDQEARLKGVMFLEIYLPGKPMVWSNSSPPFPKVPPTNGAENLLQSRVLWQSMHTMTVLARYFPFAIRSEVLLIFTSCRGILGMANF